MINTIKRFWLRKKFGIRPSNIFSRFIYNEVKKVAIIAEEGDTDFKKAQSFLGVLNFKNSQATFFSFVQENASNIESSKSHIFCSKKSFSCFFGIPTDVELTNFIKTDFDLLIDLSEGNKYTDMAVEFSHARLRIGNIQMDKKHLYDMMFDMGEEGIAHEVKKYLKIINLS
ncbi:DUF6913 domain-containing protein [Ichthyobacterium seriolicida]|uniref:Uncharacterized protein n=1 Tax=Ichthyobacterium seriolicida TaxID=242600 RepID=A0A1J1E0R6_9FLAO|nr:hypothetical protein [Ichthyobacterium seriolicida]BAV94525.1 hypothetical protein JBKA6_0512 [Ichthyobacterium seriolicida]